MLASASVQAQIGVPVAPLARSASIELQRFELYTACQPVRLVVENLSPDASDIGLTKSDIITTIRSRLRGARIYSADPNGYPYLYVHVSNLRISNVEGINMGGAYNIEVSLNKIVADLETELIYPTQTWQRGMIGYHGRYNNNIRQVIGEYIDLFIDEYLAVNESACE